MAFNELDTSRPDETKPIDDYLCTNYRSWNTVIVKPTSGVSTSRLDYGVLENWTQEKIEPHVAGLQRNWELTSFSLSVLDARFSHYSQPLKK